jgi:hypothetical protein
MERFICYICDIFENCEKLIGREIRKVEGDAEVSDAHYKNTKASGYSRRLCNQQKYFFKKSIHSHVVYALQAREAVHRYVRILGQAV